MNPGPQDSRKYRTYETLDRIKKNGCFIYKYKGLYFKPGFLVKLNKFGLLEAQLKTRISRLLLGDCDITTLHDCIHKKPYENKTVRYKMDIRTRETNGKRGSPLEYFLDVDSRFGKKYHEWYLLTDLVNKKDFPECTVTLPGLRCRLKSGRYPNLYAALTGEISSPTGGKGKVRTKTETSEYQSWLDGNSEWIGLLNLWPAGSLAHTVR